MKRSFILGVVMGLSSICAGAAEVSSVNLFYCAVKCRKTNYQILDLVDYIAKGAEKVDFEENCKWLSDNSEPNPGGEWHNGAPAWATNSECRGSNTACIRRETIHEEGYGSAFSLREARAEARRDCEDSFHVPECTVGGWVRDYKSRTTTFYDYECTE